MHKKDYLQRRLEEFGKVLALILQSKKNQDWEEFEKEISEAVQKYTSLEVTVIEAMGDEDFETTVLSRTDLAQEQKKIMATLLFEKLSYYLEKNDVEKYTALKTKCLHLYQHLYNNLTDNEFDLDVHYKLNFLNKI